MIVVGNNQSLDDVLRKCIVQNLNAVEQDLDKAAKVLGLDVRTLKRRIESYGIDFKEVTVAY